MAHVRAYTRTVNGHAVQVSDHERSDPVSRGNSDGGGVDRPSTGKVSKVKRSAEALDAKLKPAIEVKKYDMKKRSAQLNQFNNAVDQLPNVSETERFVYRKLFVIEGGTKVDSRSEASSGITTETLSKARMEWGVTGLTANVFPKDLSATQRAAIMRAYFNANWKDAGGSAALEAITDENVAAFTADTTYRYGPRGNKIIKTAINKVRMSDGQPGIAVDLKFDKAVLDEINSIIATKNGKEKFASALKKVRDDRTESERWRTTHYSDAITK